MQVISEALSQNARQSQVERTEKREEDLRLKRNYCREYYKKNPWIKTFSYIKGRCLNKNHSGYHNYGMKGIKCLISVQELKELWFRDKAFLLKKASIDRINSKDHYRFDNCRFIEHSDNCRMRNALSKARRVVRINNDGTEMEFESILSAERFHGHKGRGAGKLWESINSGSNKAYGFMWRTI